MKLKELKNWRPWHERTSLIIGGGTSLVKDLASDVITGIEVKIAVNHHANILFPDYAIVEDQLTFPLMADIRTEYSEVMGRYPEADIDIREAPNWNNGGMNAVWIADYLGFKEVILAGFDCFKPGNRWHWHDHLYNIPPWDYPEMKHKEIVEVWKEVKEYLQHPERVYPISGVLREIFTCI